MTFSHQHIRGRVASIPSRVEGIRSGNREGPPATTSGRFRHGSLPAPPGTGRNEVANIVKGLRTRPAHLRFSLWLGEVRP